MCGIEEKRDEVFMMKIDRQYKYESYDGMCFEWMACGGRVTHDLVEVLLLWKEVLCSYSLSFLNRADRDAILYAVQCVLVHE